MAQAKPVQTALAQHFKLSAEDSPKTISDTERMHKLPYSSVVGSLMYLMVCTRPDIAYAVSLVSRYLAKPGQKHWEAAKWILRYLKGTANYGLVYGRNASSQHEICGFVDSDFAKDADRGRSISGYVFQVMGCTVSWRAALQRVVALSTTEAEYMALTEAVKEALWLKGMLNELGLNCPVAIVKCDNQGAIQLSKNPMFHERTKHINVRLHFIRDVIEDGDVEVEKVHTSENAADVLTKSLPSDKFYQCLQIMGVCEAEGVG